MIDAIGRKVEARDGSGARTRFQYDAAHRVSSITDPAGGVTTAAYDGSGNLLTMADTLGRATTYGARGRFTAQCHISAARRDWGVRRR